MAKAPSAHPVPCSRKPLQLMPHDRIERRRRAQLVFAVLAVGIVMSALVAVALIYMGQVHPRS